MAISKGSTFSTTTKHEDVVNAIEYLATVQQKERTANYRHCNYLRIDRGNRFSHHNDDDSEVVRSVCSYLSHNRPVKRGNQWEISMEGRVQVGQWFFKMTSCFGFPGNFAVIAMNYFDRVLSRRNPLPNTKAEIQLLALSCFYLVVKIFQAGPILSSEQICMISGFAFSPSQIVDTEQMILLALDWCLYPPTALEYITPYLQILDTCTNLPLQLYANEIKATTESFIHEMTLDYYFVANQFLPSHIALAALINAIFTILPPNNTITGTIHDITRMLSQISDYPIDEQDVIFCCERLLRLMNNNITPTNNYHESRSSQHHTKASTNPYHTVSDTTTTTNIIHHPSTNALSQRSPVTVTSYTSMRPSSSRYTKSDYQYHNNNDNTNKTVGKFDTTTGCCGSSNDVDIIITYPLYYS